MTKSVQLAQVRTCLRRANVGQMRSCLNRGSQGRFLTFLLTHPARSEGAVVQQRGRQRRSVTATKLSRPQSQPRSLPKGRSEAERRRVDAGLRGTATRCLSGRSRHFESEPKALLVPGQQLPSNQVDQNGNDYACGECYSHTNSTVLSGIAHKDAVRPGFTGSTTRSVSTPGSSAGRKKEAGCHQPCQHCYKFPHRVLLSVQAWVRWLSDERDLRHVLSGSRFESFRRFSEKRLSNVSSRNPLAGESVFLE